MSTSGKREEQDVRPQEAEKEKMEGVMRHSGLFSVLGKNVNASSMTVRCAHPRVSRVSVRVIQVSRVIIQTRISFQTHL